MLNGSRQASHSGSIPNTATPTPTRIPVSLGMRQTFKDYIEDPRAKILKYQDDFPRHQERKEAGDLWAYLKQFGPDGK